MVALLVFLMCACVGSVVLAAASTSAGKVSSVESSGNADRYAVNSAVSLLKEEMNSSNIMSIEQNWTGEYTQADFDASGNTGIPQLTKGTWVKSSSDDNWSTQISTGNNSSFDVSNLLKDTGTVQADYLYQIRDMMAYEIYLHYWNDISAYGSGTEDNPDPWSTIAMGKQDWQNILDETDSSYKITGSAPFELNLTDESLPTVYALFSMDSSFQMEIELYCLDEEKNKTEDRFLIFTPDTASVKRTSSETEAKRITNNSFQLSNGSVVSNTTYTYDFTRTVTLSLSWKTGTISTSGGTE